MTDYGPSTYGDRWADVYDEWMARYVTLGDAERAAARLAALAGDGRALELAIGTGRIALPLRARGVDVQGIDASEAMVAKLRAKPGGEDIAVTLGDFADVAVEGTFRLVFVVFNTFFGLLSQEDQVRCFANVAHRLDAGGVFVVEAFVPDMTRFDRDQRVETRAVETDSLHLSGDKHDPVAQRVDSLHVVVEESGIHTLPVRIRYAWPSELDLMARLAGLRLRHRWSDWDEAPFTASSRGYVSVYERA
jgi:SAM-dependent methyltransferase